MKARTRLRGVGVHGDEKWTYSVARKRTPQYKPKPDDNNSLQDREGYIDGGEVDGWCASSVTRHSSLRARRLPALRGGDRMHERARRTLTTILRGDLAAFDVRSVNEVSLNSSRNIQREYCQCLAGLPTPAPFNARSLSKSQEKKHPNSPQPTIITLQDRLPPQPLVTQITLGH